MPKPLNVAFPPIGGDGWMGGQNYLANLVTQILEYCLDKVNPYLFVGDEYAPALMEKLEAKGAHIIRDPYFNKAGQPSRMIRSILLGSDTVAARHYQKHAIDCLFENATYHGRNFPLPNLNWIPDFQHRLMPQLFSRKGYWRRELGFRLTTKGRSHIMLSSQDAAQDYRRLYNRPSSSTHVVPFAVPPSVKPAPDEISAVKTKYKLPAKWIFLPNQFWQHKNHIVVIEALANVIKDKPEICVVCTGATIDPRAPNYFSGLMQKVDHYQLQSNFRTLGLIPYTDVGALLEGSLALLNPSKFEGWSTVVEEAKAAGKLLILSDLPVHREQCGDRALYFGVDGHTELAKHLVCAFENTSHQNTNAVDDQACRKFAENFASAIERVVASNR